MTNPIVERVKDGLIRSIGVSSWGEIAREERRLTITTDDMEDVVVGSGEQFTATFVTVAPHRERFGGGLSGPRSGDDRAIDQHPLVGEYISVLCLVDEVIAEFRQMVVESTAIANTDGLHQVAVRLGLCPIPTSCSPEFLENSDPGFVR
nr:hypothetical protein [Salinigranum salinum]